MGACPVQVRTGGSLYGRDLRTAISQFQAPMLRASLSQIGTSFLPFIAVCSAMYVTIAVSYWLTLGLAVVAAGFIVRIFVIQHDCGHGSFFKSRQANDVLGMLCSIITLTPYAHWRRQHAGHHAVWNNLDQRLSGSDIYSTSVTVDEYLAMTWLARLIYRVGRHPIVSVIILPPMIFLFLYRMPFDTPKTWKRERRAVYRTNLAITAVIVALGLLAGFERVLLIHLPIIVIASIIGVWIFAVQHRFDTSLWQRQTFWTFESAALRGSSYLHLPLVLQWFTANIGFHHVHHLNPRIPNYRLAACHAAIPTLQTVRTLTIWSGLRALSFVLWDEKRQEMISFSRAHTRSTQCPS